MPVKPLYRRCENCGKNFATFDEEKIYCNQDCEFRGKWKKSRIASQVDCIIKGAHKCPGCDLFFTKKVSFQKYCTPMCQENACQERERKKRRKNKTYEKICPNCNNRFTINTDAIKYCSLICRDDSSRKKKKSDPPKKRRRMPYHVLNMIAERKRLDENWNRLTR